ncbi:hypothetical protein P7F60_02520 [Rhizobium sp. YJ-22]|uniref:hypothetical protein n=1 Tax=Rhizobium sp. YJ-22 TaxID=3037556 RepID=UPI002412B00D|nr:hypothetical protein [Rhizobium sp. YJ-22]MDG3575249.1 hypothetical protein [Rhizobium sp. YJ-22]
MRFDVQKNTGFQRRNEERTPPQVYRLRQPGRIIVLGAGLVRASSRACTIVELSQRSAWLTTLTTLGIPDHVLLSIDGFAANIGCAVAHCGDGRLAVNFLAPLHEARLADIVEAAFAGGVAPSLA